eukprot:4369192-Amphidinium_carterae.2
MACVFDGGVVMGCDTRMSTGDFVASRSSRKISKATPCEERHFVITCSPRFSILLSTLANQL